ncbi:hypothetical protein C5708_18880 [Caulobacter sp. CCUG 60055]|uniref:alpha/beta hydrolase family protein n=1 Tax=Caulobacter sp. CCUG 60055 TaxID=2100090 RepID=UPI001FA6EBFB|nr:hypothetical protein [Caulobacter sp. CCUG 60055]MCI3182311.1 hypothetical protein [Caulobacter sp. CCUG 60055]
MLIFDTLTLGLLTLWLLSGLVGALKKTPWPTALAILALAACATHLLVEGPRWQMGPAYVVLLVLAVLQLGAVWPPLGGRFNGAGGRTRGAARWIAALLLVLTVVASFLFPMFRLPKPSGAYAVGTTTLHFVDPSRYELHTVEPFDRRELMAHVWYPATAAAGAKPVPYLTDPDVMAQATAGSLPLAPFFTHLGAIPTHSFQDAPISPARRTYPVVVFSHGRNAFWGQNLTLMEDLASRGYVVVAIDHVYGAGQSDLPGGRVARFVPEVYENRGPEPHRGTPPSEADLKAIATSLKGDEVRSAIQKLMAYSPRADAKNRYGLNIWIADQRFILDQIESLQTGRTPSPFAGRLDLSRLGMMGMSFGGAATIATCATDDRCKAGVSLDGFALHLTELPPRQHPFMTLNSGDYGVNLAIFGRGPSWDYWMQVRGANHSNFTDLPMVTRLWRLAGLAGDVKGGAGPIDPGHMQALLRAYVSAFFDKHLMGAPAPLLDGPSPDFPEVRHFTVKRPSCAATEPGCRP